MIEKKRSKGVGVTRGSGAAGQGEDRPTGGKPWVKGYRGRKAEGPPLGPMVGPRLVKRR